MRYLILSSVVFSFASVQAQNLVPNGSFEEYTTCPTNQGQVERCVGWTSNSASPDYFNRCDTNGFVDVPFNLIGYQNAFDGDAYMGGATYLEGAPTYRECIQHALSSALVPGIPVYISMMIATGGFGNDPGQNSLRYASNGIGMKFSVEQQIDYSYWPGNVALYRTEILCDTAVWVELSGMYIPDSAYAFVYIGSFLPYDEIQVQVIDANAVSSAAYAFFDRVCVSTNAADCAVTLMVDDIRPPIRIQGSNPFANDLFLSVDNELTENSTLVLIDELGRIGQQVQLPQGTKEFVWPLPVIPAGSYFLQLRNSLGRSRPIHLVHINP